MRYTEFSVHCRRPEILLSANNKIVKKAIASSRTGKIIALVNLAHALPSEQQDTESPLGVQVLGAKQVIT